MSSPGGSRPPTVLLVGATGRTGRRVLRQLLDGGAAVRVIVRSAARLPPELATEHLLTILEADLLSLGMDDIQRWISGCDVVVSCLGHPISLRGIFGPPRDLVTRATIRLCRAIQSLRPAVPIRFILMCSVSVNRPDGLDTRRGMAERAFLWVLRLLVPPSRDSQDAVDFLTSEVGASDPFVKWVAVRPDTLKEGDVSEYLVRESIVSSVFTPAHTRMANVAHFMRDLTTDATTWDRWQGGLPVIVDLDSVPGHEPSDSGRAAP